MRIHYFFTVVFVIMVSSNGYSTLRAQPPELVKCELAQAVMHQQLIESAGKVRNDNTITLTTLKVPSLGVLVDSIKLEWTGEIYLGELEGLLLRAIPENETISGTVTLKKLGVSVLKDNDLYHSVDYSCDFAP